MFFVEILEILFRVPYVTHISWKPVNLIYISSSTLITQEVTKQYRESLFYNRDVHIMKSCKNNMYVLA